MATATEELTIELTAAEEELAAIHAHVTSLHVTAIEGGGLAATKAFAQVLYYLDYRNAALDSEPGEFEDFQVSLAKAAYAKIAEQAEAEGN